MKLFSVMKIEIRFSLYYIEEKEKRMSYELSYFTPNLKEGIILFIAGLMLFIILAFIYKNKKDL